MSTFVSYFIETDLDIPNDHKMKYPTTWQQTKIPTNH